jgi:aspartyl-tRNA(Asn)/glutamyl-tRNA(Gln) amidotransferase subunit C
MPIEESQVRHIAALARISLSESEIESFTQQLSDILDQFEILQNIDTTNVAPTAHVAGLDNVLRDDEPRDSLESEQSLLNAPRRRGDFFQVRAVLDE